MAINVVMPSGQANYNASGNGLTLEQQTFYDRNLLSRLLPNLVYALFGQPKPMPRNAGQTVQYRKFLSLDIPASPLQEGVTPTSRNLTMSSVTVTPEQWGDYIEITDLVDMTAIDPVFVEAGELQGEQVALRIDTVVRDVLAAGTNVQYAAGRASRITVASTDKLTGAEILKAVRTFANNKVKKLTNILDASTGNGTQPIPASYVAVVSPSTVFDLKADAKWVPVHEYPSQAGVLPFEVGSIDEVRFVQSSNAKVFAAAGAAGIDVHCTIVMGAGAFGMVSPSGVETVIKGFGEGNDPLNQRATSGWKAYFNAVRLEEAAILRIEHAVSA